jgi:hypothetical protein
MSTPPVGSMYFYDDITPPLLDNSYQMSMVTNVTFDGAVQPLQPATGYFNVEGPRFSLSATEVGGVFPPNNGHGGFDEAIPHIALLRRTLPWERALTSRPDLIGTPTRAAGDPPPPNPIAQEPGQYGPPPWLALLLFEEGEYVLNRNVALQDAVPADVYQRLEAPPGVTCDTIQADYWLVQSLLPSLEELTLLTHVRQVNVEDRELNSGSSDGWFAVVMSNRLPSPGAKYRACLVSLEERTDLVKANPPAVATEGGRIILEARDLTPAHVLDLHPPDDVSQTTVLANADARRIVSAAIRVDAPSFGFFHTTVQLVLLYSWQFECTGVGTFRDYMQRINVSMTGTVEEPGHPVVSDTSHIQISLQDRAGVAENVWYRGPLVPFPLTRDPLTYHSADQCRRVTPDTGAEDVSYAAAFEAGRLLAAADGRLAQELMRWRREAFRQSARIDLLGAIKTAMALPQALDKHSPVATTVAVNAAKSIVTGISALADRYGLSTVSQVPGLDPAQVQQAWNLSSVEDAATILGANPGATGVSVAPPVQTTRTTQTIDQAAADKAGLQTLTNARSRMLANAQLQVENQP